MMRGFELGRWYRLQRPPVLAFGCAHLASPPHSYHTASTRGFHLTPASPRLTESRRQYLSPAQTCRAPSIDDNDVYDMYRLYRSYPIHRHHHSSHPPRWITCYRSSPAVVPSTPSSRHPRHTEHMVKPGNAGMNFGAITQFASLL